MRTDELITMLARGAGAAPRAPAAARIAPALLVGGVAALALSLSMRSAVPSLLLAEPGMLLKIGYALALAVGGGWLAARLGRPLARTAAPVRVLAATLALIVLLGSAVVALAPDGHVGGAQGRARALAIERLQPSIDHGAALGPAQQQRI